MYMILQNFVDTRQSVSHSVKSSLLLSEWGVINLIDNCIRQGLCHELSDNLNNLGIDDLMSNARPVWIQIMKIGFRETVAVVFYRIVDNPNQKQIHHDQCFEMIGYRILASWANTCSCIMKVPRERIRMRSKRGLG